MKGMNDIMHQLERLRNPANVEGMKRFGVIPANGKAFGLSTPELRNIAKSYKKDTDLALNLWAEGYHETLLLATLIADPKQFASDRADAWTHDFGSWDICDAACFNLFRYLPFADDKVFLYAPSEKEYVRRTAFSLIAGMCFSAKKAPDNQFLAYLPLVEQYADDDRNFVKKSVNWALRQIGKKNKNLYEPALLLARKLAAANNKTVRWIGKDAVRELENPKIIARIKR